MVEVGRISLGAAACAAVGLSSLSPSQARADDAPSQVDVHGAPRSPAAAPRDPTVAGAVVSREELSAPGLRPAEVLRGQVGVQVTETGGVGAPSTASVRGATAAQLPVYLAGVPLNDDVVGTADLSRIPLWLIDRVEIYRGNAPLDADRLGIGGAIFIEPRRPHGPEAGAGQTLGSYGQRGAFGYAAAGDRDASVLAGFSAEAATNDYPFVNDHGTLLAPTGTVLQSMTNAQVTTYDAWLLGSARVGAGRVETFANATTREQGVPTLALVPSQQARATFDRGLAGAVARVPLDRAGRAWLEARSSVLLARAEYQDPLQELALQARTVTLGGTRADERLASDVEATPSLTVHGAMDVSTELLARDDDRAPALRAHRLATRAAASARQWLGPSLSLQALAAAQCDGTSRTAATSTCDTFAPAGRFGAAWTSPTWTVFANVGRYARTPTLGELYGMSVLVRGNPALAQETGVSTDVGLRFAARQHGETRAPWGFVGGFARWSGELVSFVRSAQGYVEPINVGSARVQGLEAQLGAGFLRWFAVDVSATLLDPRDTTAGRLVVNDILPFQSRLVLVPRLAAETRDLGVRPVGRLRAEVRWVYQSSRYADTAGLAVIPEQASLDAELLAQSRDGHFTVRVRATDLLDSARFDVVGFPLPGRSAFASLEESW